MGQESSRGKLFVRVENIYLRPTGLLFRRVTWRLAVLIQYVRLSKQGEVYLDSINMRG